MTDTTAKYILAFLALMYLIACVCEIGLTKNGVELVFESVRTLVPHMAMFILGISYGRKS